MANLEINDLYQQITNKVINALSNATDWVKPWYGGFTGIPRNVITQKEYVGVNVLSLWIGGQGYSSSLWGTYKQWQSLGAQVRKGEKALFFTKTSNKQNRKIIIWKTKKRLSVLS